MTNFGIIYVQIQENCDKFLEKIGKGNFEGETGKIITVWSSCKGEGKLWSNREKNQSISTGSNMPPFIQIIIKLGNFANFRLSD